MTRTLCHFFSGPPWKSRNRRTRPDGRDCAFGPASINQALRGARRVNVYQEILAVMDLRSFSNLWFWIALAVFWSGVSHFILGVPYDLVVRARRRGGEAEQDLLDMVRLSSSRILNVMDEGGLIIIGFSMFTLSVLVTLAAAYRIEFAQALLSLYAPMLIVVSLTVRTARRIRAQKPDLEDLYRRMMTLRLSIQGIGVVCMLITSLWGMTVNLTAGPN